MRKLIIISILLLASIGLKAQFTNFNAFGLQRKIVGVDTTWRFAGSGSNGFRSFNPNPSGGSADSVTFRTKNNSYSLAGMQTKLNNYTLQSRNVTAGIGLLGGGSLTTDRVIYIDSAVTRTVSNSFTKAQSQPRITLTTTGGSGAATLVGSTLNIPIYTGGGGGSVTSVTSVNTDISVATTTSTPVLTLNSGYGLNQVVKRITNGIAWDSGLDAIITNDPATKYWTFNAGTSTYGGYIFKNNSNQTRLQIETNGDVKFPQYASGTATPTPTGTKHMITVDANGLMGHETIPSGGGVSTNLALGTPTSTTYPITNSNGTGFTLPAATSVDAGLMSAADKTALGAATNLWSKSLGIISPLTANDRVSVTTNLGPAFYGQNSTAGASQYAFYGVTVDAVAATFMNNSSGWTALIAENSTGNIQDWQKTGSQVVARMKNNGTLHLYGGFAPSYTAKTATYTINNDDYTIDCNGTFTVTLPTLPGKPGQIFVVKNSGSGVITVSGTIDGVSGATLTAGAAGNYQWTSSAYIKIN